jgi:hypothetical protein
MGQLSAQSMVDRVRSALANPDPLLVSDDFILQWLNQVLLRISSKYDFAEYCKNETITTVAGTAEYTMTGTDVLYIENVVNTTTKFDMKKCDETDYDLWISSVSVQGIPTHYFVSDVVNTNGADTKKLTYYPTPSGVFSTRARYRKKVTQLVIDPTPNYSPLSSLWDHVLIYGAIAEGWLHLTEPDKMAAFAAMEAGSEAEAWKMENYPTEVPASIGRAFGAGVR